MCKIIFSFAEGLHIAVNSVASFSKPAATTRLASIHPYKCRLLSSTAVLMTLTGSPSMKERTLPIVSP